MATTQILNQILKNGTFPIVQSISAPNNCGSISLSLGGSWTDQMISELPSINFSVFMQDGTKLLSVDFNMDTFTTDSGYIEISKPYSIALYNLPTSFNLHVTPIFDSNAISSHNDQIETGDVTIFQTSASGIVDTNVENYKSELWTTPTQTFTLDIIFDDSNIVPGSGGGGGGSSITVDTQVLPTSTNPVQNKAIYNFVNSSVATNTAYFIGTFNSVQDLENYSGEISNNDYAFVVSTDSDGNTVYNRYKYSSDTSQWSFEYALNNSSFTANQWDNINSTFTQITPAEVRSLWRGAEVALIPTMTSASDTIGTVSYGNSYGSGGMYGTQDPWLPFDGNDSTCLYYMNENVTDGWLQYTFNTPELVTTIKALFGNYLASNSIPATLYVYDINGTEIEKNTVTVTGWNQGTYGEYVFPVNMAISKFKFVFGYKQNATNIMTYTVQAYTLAT